MIETIVAGLRCASARCVCHNNGSNRYTLHCPAHSDEHPSLSLTVDDGKILVHCHAGCAQADVINALSERSLWGDSSSFKSGTPKQPARGVTLAELASAKKLPVEFLQQLGLSESLQNASQVVRIPYKDTNGQVVALRFRLGLSRSNLRFNWRKGGHPLLYGLEQLEAIRSAGYVWLVEGESDCWTLWHHKIPALGIPGKSTWRDEWAKHLEGLEVYLWQEPDAADLAERVSASLPTCHVVKAPDGIKDPSEAHLLGFDLPTWLESLKTTALPIESKGDAKSSAIAAIEQQLAAVAELDGDQRSDGLRSLFCQLAACDEYDLILLKPKVMQSLNLGKREVGKLLTAARKSNSAADTDNEQIIEDKYPILSPALDFHDDIGIVAVSLPVRISNRVECAPYLVTSTRELIPLRDSQRISIGGTEVLLSHIPSGLGSQSRWNYSDIQAFLDGYAVDPRKAFGCVRALFEIYLEFQQPYTAAVLSLWTLGTYLYPLFEAYPYISLHGPKGSGKTKTLNLAEKMAFNMRVSSSLSGPSLFRIIQGSRATLGIDEGERFAHRNDPAVGDLRLLLNSGYKRGSPALRVEGDSEHREVKEFQVYAPKIVASIEGLEDVLASRCIRITMLRTRSEKGNLIITERAEDWAMIRHRLYSFALTYFASVRSVYETADSIRFLSNRSNELWLPLLAIAKFLEDAGETGLLDAIEEFARGSTRDDEDQSLSDLEQAVALALFELTKGAESQSLTPKVIAERINSVNDLGNPINPQSVGYIMQRFGLIRSRNAKGSIYHVTHQFASELMERYGIRKGE